MNFFLLLLFHHGSSVRSSTRDWPMVAREELDNPVCIISTLSVVSVSMVSLYLSYAFFLTVSIPLQVHTELLYLNNLP